MSGLEDFPERSGPGDIVAPALRSSVDDSFADPCETHLRPLGFRRTESAWPHRTRWKTSKRRVVENPRYRLVGKTQKDADTPEHDGEVTGKGVERGDGDVAQAEMKF